MARYIQAVAALAFCISLAGCVNRTTVREFQGHKIPYHAEKLDEGFVEKLATVNSIAPQVERVANVFPFPSILIYRNFSNKDNNGNVAATSFTWYDLFLGSIGISLPLAVNYTDNHYSAETGERVAQRRAVYTPLWASSSSEGEFARGMNIEASGIPILWGRMKFSETNREGVTGTAKMTSFLWTLGPMVVQMRTSDDSAGGYMAAPLLLGGLLGGILWSDYHLRDGESMRIGHGPLLGFLGYTQWRIVRPPTFDETETMTRPRAENSRRLVLGGVLWEDTRNVEGTDTVTSTSHGPLWGMLGWGSKEGRFALRLLWIPIKF